ncbi:RNA 2',3'-cyclic phosphodiesterase [Kaistia dalseonensis]|uniref:RNA 2',3'-cyclic phosphodiesterase n=1 Tax=Kaistia dalseonensis TaxID=410840 RepID=A0ABU0H3L9_9HYPH|nr:RNA 2',3'-cyclic phosphodiesterase [Kaistia dalseonensis]MCX5494310.1 RNA 2',3'-cyclic phosphodiesterase [Kaistia dalseonensis]MDQ0436891.1 2'-5' RNA ligase [Kaistia dalseonensis]
MPRLFTALEVPAEVGQRLSLLRGGLPGARWIDEEFYHVTLRFIGDIDDRTADEIADALSRVKRREIELQFGGLDVFGSSKPHSIVARVPSTRALGELQAEHERIIQRIGLPPEGRKFLPHVTLARLRGTAHRDVANYLALRGGFFAGPFPVSRFVLYSSKDSTGGGPYLLEQSYPLAEVA